MTEAGRARRRSDERPRKARTERQQRPTKAVEGSAAEEENAPARGDDESELKLARAVAIWAPVVTLLTAGAVGMTMSLGLALLVLAGGALFGTVAFFWASLRTLGGDAPLAEGFDEMSRRRIEAPDSPAERKRAALRGLKDLELEHQLGKIDDTDYAELSARYREEAKAILRELDEDVSPRRARAEELKSYLAKRGARDKVSDSAVAVASQEEEDDVAPSAPRAPARIACPACDAANERDAVFCKKCGARLAPLQCTQCGAVNEPDATFCKKCGIAVATKAGESSDAAS